ncbi:MAG: GNAT family N-acetyltransferase [Streptosporangiaceae bacterium]
MAEIIRTATPADVDAMVRMAAERRDEYSTYQPVFWHPASDAEQKHRPYLAKLVNGSDVVTLVSEDDGEPTGFIILSFTAAPPVYEPGGPTGLIDDFAVRPGRWQTTGARLLHAALAAAGERGAVQAVVVTAHLDEPKRAMLRQAGLGLASEWWVTSTADQPQRAE